MLKMESLSSSLLLNDNAEPNSFFKKSDDSAIVAIEAAISSDHADVVEYLLEKGAPATGYMGRGRYDGIDTFLARAAKNGNRLIIKSLLKHGADIQRTFKNTVYRYKEYISNCESVLRTNYSENQRKYHSEEFDNKKQKLIDEIIEYKEAYKRIIQTLLDYAVGIDLSSDPDDKFLNLSFLHGLDVSGFNFVGLSVGGKPITHAMLDELPLKGTHQAIVTTDDLHRLQTSNPERYAVIRKRLDDCIQRQGLLFSEPGVYNLIPLWRAAQIGDKEAVNSRLDAGINPNELSRDNDIYPIVHASAHNHNSIVRRLCEHPLIEKASFVSALEKARETKNEELISYFERKVDINALNVEGKSRLHIAVAKNNAAEVRELIARGADVNVEDKKGRTPLLMVTTWTELTDKEKRNAAIMVGVLLENKADPNKYKEKSPLSCAVTAGNAQMVAMLLPITNKKEVLEYDSPGDEAHRRPWYVGMLFEVINHTENVKLFNLLIDAGADVDEINYEGLTPLQQATCCNQAGVVECLLIHNAKVNKQTNKKWTALHYAVERGNKLSAQLLLKHGADLLLTNDEGLTPSQMLDQLITHTTSKNDLSRFLEVREVFAEFIRKKAIESCSSESGKISELVRQRSKLHSAIDSSEQTVKTVFNPQNSS